MSLESQLQHQVFGVDAGRVGAYLRWFLVDRPTLARFRQGQEPNGRGGGGRPSAPFALDALKTCTPVMSFKVEQPTLRNP